jgi:Autophagocytosis associated protein, active-site domain
MTFWSQSHFDQEASKLLETLKQLPRVDTSENPRISSKAVRTFLLVDWRLNKDDSTGVSYLSHPSINIPVLANQVLLEVKSARPPSTYDDDLHDDSVLVDVEQVVIDYIDDGQHAEANTITWTFSIVYSETYRVPVLYFHAEHRVSGEPCSRAQVLRYLSPGDMAAEDSWEFVSQEPHPHTGFPSYFLHPCRTAERMTVLTQGEENLIVNSLWAWMSMIFPAVGHAIPPSFYEKVQSSLCGAL